MGHKNIMGEAMDNQAGGLMDVAGQPEAQSPDIRIIPGQWFVGMLLFSAPLVFGLTMATGLTIQSGNLGCLAMVVSMALLALVRYALRDTRTGPLAPIKDFSEYCLLFMAFSLLGVIASYPIAAASFGFHDASLARMDAMIGFDWMSWYAFVARSPLLQQLGTIAYLTIYLSPAILLGYMAWQGQRAAARQFLLTFWLAACISLLLFPLFVAKGPLAILWSGPIPYMPVSALYQSEMIPALRGQLLTDIDMGALRGLVCAPSFHTVCGALYIGAAWPIARLRWPLIAMNGAMLLATPVEGNHYLTDMLLGLAVALIATAIARWIVRLWANPTPNGKLLGALQ